jgi:hypothetical protein
MELNVGLDASFDKNVENARKVDNTLNSQRTLSYKTILSRLGVRVTVDGVLDYWIY